MQKAERKKTQRPCSCLVEKLIISLREGIEVSAGTLFFLESTYGIGQEVMEMVLLDADFEERTTLSNLIFPPLIFLRMAVEPLLCVKALNCQEELAVATALAEALPLVTLIFPDTTRCECPASIADWTVFVEKLYTRRSLDTVIVSALKEHFPVDLAFYAMVFLRCKNLQIDGNKKEFFTKFVEKAACRKELSEDLLQFFLTLLSNTPENKTVEEYFFDQRRYQKKVLRDIKEFEEKMDQYGMEYLMMQRYPVPHDSEEEVIIRISQLELIIEQIMMIRDPLETCIGNHDLGRFNSKDDVEKLIRTLS